jgi:hypothetical protein
MAINRYITLLTLLFTIGNSNAQDYLSFYNLKDYVIQVQNISPIYLPKNSVTFATPLNLGLDFNSNIKLNDVLVEKGNLLAFDFDKLNSVAEKENLITTNIDANIFMLGFRIKKGSLTFFANAKSNLTWQFSDNFTNVLTNGIIDSFSFSNEKFGVTGYSEIGIGITQKLFKDKIAIGLRFKSLNGIMHAEFDRNTKFSVNIDPSTFYWNVISTNASIHTAGINNTDDFTLFGENKGFGLDLGLSYQISKKLSFDFAINDIGSINWKQSVSNYNIEDTNGAIFTGVDIVNNESIEDAVDRIIGFTETYESFNTQLATKTFFSAKYQHSQKNIITASYFKNENQYLETKPNYALGYNRALERATYGVTFGTQGFGANFSVQLSFLQLYGAVSDVSNISSSVEESKSANIRFGINLLFGRKNKANQEDLKEDIDKEA